MDTRNLILAAVVSVVIMIGWNYLVVVPEQERLAQQQAQVESSETVPVPAPGSVAPPGSEEAAGSDLTMTMSRAEALDASPRVEIETPTLRGSLALKGARLDDLVLTRYRETIDPDSPQIKLLSPVGTHQPYFAYFSWSAAGSGTELPNKDTLWQSNGTRLTPDTPVTLTWTNSQGVTFQQTYSVDENYMFQVTQSISNKGTSPITLAPYGLMSRTGHPEILGFYILHEGLIGVLDGALEEIDYDDVEDTGSMSYQTTGGWIGITDKYWLVTLVPDQQATIDARFVHSLGGNQDKYQSDILYQGIVIQPGARQETTSHLFAGAKEVILLDGYAETLNITLFDRAVDFGWFYYLTKPFFYVLHYLAGILGNFGLAILAFTVLIKLVFFPLANKSYKAMAKMRKVQPEMLQLRERFGDDKQRLNQEMMALYKREGANPMSGCLPILIQIPVFFALYKVLFVTIEMRQAPFYGWIHDLSAPDPTSILNLFGLLPYQVPNLGLLDIISIGIWPILMGASMVFQHRLNPQPTDPMQAKIFALMPIIFTFLLAKFPAGLVIYWTWNNILSILQQVVIMKRAGVPIGRQPAAPSPAGPASKAGVSAGATAAKPSENESADEAESAEAAEDVAEEVAAQQAQPKQGSQRGGRRRSGRRRSGGQKNASKSKRRKG